MYMNMLCIQVHYMHLHTYLLKTRISWYCDFSWCSISSTSRDIACPAHKSFISVNQPFMFLSILQHKEINICSKCTRLRHYVQDEISTLYGKVYTLFLVSLQNSLLAKYIKMLGHNHLIYNTYTHWLY